MTQGHARRSEADGGWTACGGPWQSDRTRRPGFGRLSAHVKRGACKLSLKPAPLAPLPARAA
ncbi:hypothetical protein GLE_0274 [Lysobacter enzymogenes]|uniref:Uncharacterized protein n=1 Tax=Lysobacter enzymogenes TaxID=69 RepID=A0A0S2DAR4_LYSEN|nr:hypothetical protein GLE_0274 [Lysobacter enzymogenes]